MLFSTAAGALPREIPCYSLLECYTDGRFDSTKWLRLRRKEDEEYIDKSAEILSTDYCNVGDKSNDPPSQHERKKWQRHIILARRSESGDSRQFLLLSQCGIIYMSHVQILTALGSKPNIASDLECQTILMLSLFKQLRTRIGSKVG